MKEQAEAPYVMVPNARTGRIQVYKEIGCRDVLVASIHGTATEAEILALARKLREEGW